jgi:hypothetical protein
MTVAFGTTLRADSEIPGGVPHSCARGAAAEA